MKILHVPKSINLVHGNMTFAILLKNLLRCQKLCGLNSSSQKGGHIDGETDSAC